MTTTAHSLAPRARAALLLAHALLLAARSLHAQSAQSSRPVPDARLERRAVDARRVSGPAPVIDGRLDDAAWDGVPAARDFVLSRPRPGGAPTLPTEARVVYDGEALYVAVRAYDPSPDSILAPYPRRDDEVTSDWLFVELDTRHDRRSGFSFGVNPRGVQVDGTWANDVDYDAAWNGVWEGAARVDSVGWTAELRIPFSQLALPARRDSAAVFGLNVYRFAPHRGEVSNWSPRLPTLTGVVSHFNELRGVAPPSAGHRVQLVPYASTRAAHAPPRAGDVASAALPRGGAAFAGADLRVRLTPAFALSAALRPDFGQVEADPAVINLTGLESFFPEQRPFFVDAADRFTFDAVTTAVPGQSSLSGFGAGFRTRDLDLGDDTPFYSRRIGRAPHSGVLAGLPGLDVRDAPAVTDILGAAKVAGRSDRGWSLGVLGALTERETARVRLAPTAADVGVPVEPRTGYAVARVSRDRADGRGSVGGVLTAVQRAGVRGTLLDERLAREAVVAGVDGRRRFGGAEGDAYELSGFAAASDVAGSAGAIRSVMGDGAHALLRPDAEHLARYRSDSARRRLDGAAAQLRVARPAGHWPWSVTAHAITPGFASNDVGFVRSTDWLLAVGTVAYQEYRPGRLFRRWSVGLDQAGLGWSTGGERRGAVASLRAAGELRSEWGGSVAVERELPALSTDALRGGPALLLPARTTLEATVHSDTRRSTQATARLTHSRDDAAGGGALTLGATLDARLTDRLRVDVKPSVSRTRDAWHYVAGLASGDAGAPTCDAPAFGGRCWVVGRLVQTTATLTARVDLAFTARSTLQLYAQPLVGAADYDRFALVTAPRDRDPARRTRALSGGLPSGLADPSFATRQLLGTAVWRWEYRPGSTLFVVATQRRAGEDADARWDPAGAVHALGRDPATTVVQVKWSYWWQP